MLYYINFESWTLRTFDGGKSLTRYAFKGELNFWKYKSDYYIYIWDFENYQWKDNLR